MKKCFLLLLLPFSAFCQQARLPHAAIALHGDYYTVEDSSFAIFESSAGNTLSAYSAPGGGRLLRSGSGQPSGYTKWAFEGKQSPAFLMIRDTQQQASVFPLEAPVFALKERVYDSKGTAFQCNASTRTGSRVTAELWTLQGQMWKRKSSQTLTEDPSLIRFEIPETEKAGAQVRFLSGTTVYHTETLSTGTRLGDSHFRVYPNPTKAAFTISAAIAGSIRLYDLTGKQLYATTVEKGNTELKPASIVAGTYQLQFESKEGAVESRFIQIIP